MVKSEEIESLFTLGQVNDAGLGCLGLQPEFSQQRGQPRQRGLRLLPRVAHHQRVVRIADQHTVLGRRPCPVQPVQVDVAEHRRDHPALRRASRAVPKRPALHHSGAQHATQEPEDSPVTNALLDRLH